MIELTPPPCPDEECRYFPDCGTSRHHTYWPRNEYTTPVEKRFRSLAVNVGEMCVRQHEILHMTTPPPDKPSREEMLDVIREHGR